MKARRPPIGLLLGFGAGFSLLVIGIVALFGIIVDEKRHAAEELREQRYAAKDLVATRVRAALGAALARAEGDIAAALADPLLPSDDLLLIEDGVQLLPPGSGQGDGSARRLLDDLAAGKTPEHHELAERLAKADVSLDAWLEHRRRYVLPIALELASTLFALERFAHAGQLTPAQAQALLRDGLSAPPPALPGFLPQLLGARARLAPDDFALLLTRAASLAKPLLVRVDDVLLRARAVAPPLPAPWSTPARFGPTLAPPWLAQSDGSRLVGRAVDLDAVIAQAHAGLPEHVQLVPNKRDGPVATLAFSVGSTVWDEAQAELERRFWFKAITLGAVALLALVVFALALLLQRRRAAFLDLRSHLLAAVTHELKTPLASIRAMAETLELRLADHPGARDYPRRIVAASERLELMVDNVLSFARLEREAWQPRFETIAIADLASWLAADPVARAPRPVDFSSDVASGLTLSGDVALVRLMLSNLVDNAAKYATAERVAVRFSARRDERGVALSVSDDGPGLGVRDPNALFDDFQRGHVEGVRGTGLGLAICKRVMALHGGAISVATSPAGSTFTAVFSQ